MIKFVRKVIVGVAISYAASSVVNLLERARLAKKAELDNEREQWGVSEEGLRNALRRVNNATEEMRAATANLAEEVKAYEEVFGKVELGEVVGLEPASVTNLDWKVVGRTDQGVKLRYMPGEGDFEPTHTQHEIVFTQHDIVLTRFDGGTCVVIPAIYEKDHDEKHRF